MSVESKLIEIAVSAAVAAAGVIIERLLPDEKDQDFAASLLTKRLQFRLEAQRRLDARKGKT